jgi:hypothetical protein
MVRIQLYPSHTPCVYEKCIFRGAGESNSDKQQSVQASRASILCPCSSSVSTKVCRPIEVSTDLIIADGRLGGITR